MSGTYIVAYIVGPPERLDEKRVTSTVSPIEVEKPVEPESIEVPPNVVPLRRDPGKA
jgi:hypothetical protein